MDSSAPRILVTGGGTSGHISPALAVIEALQLLAKPEFLYIGGQGGIEQELVEAAALPFAGIATGKLRRYFSWRNFVDAGRIPLGLRQSLGLVRQFAPHVLLSTGGYVAVPPVLAARLLRVPIIIHEQTVQIGLANRITARYATRIAISFEAARHELPVRQQRKAFLAGNPVRSTIFGGSPPEGLRIAGFSPYDAALPTIYVTGGSQGASSINRAVESVLEELLAFCRVIHQCGRQPPSLEQDYDRLTAVAARLPQRLRGRYHVTAFLRDEIKHVYALADLLVGRAGAGTVTEACALGKPAVYIPLVPTGGDEQTRNATMCQEIGAAVVLRQADLDGPRLLHTVRELLEDPRRLTSMGQAARTLARPDAAAVIARAVLELAARPTQ